MKSIFIILIIAIVFVFGCSTKQEKSELPDLSYLYQKTTGLADNTYFRQLEKPR